MYSYDVEPFCLILKAKIQIPFNKNFVFILGLRIPILCRIQLFPANEIRRFVGKKPESSRSCRASYKNLGQNLGQKFGTKSGTKIWGRQTDKQTDKTRHRVALQLKRKKIKAWIWGSLSLVRGK